MNTNNTEQEHDLSGLSPEEMAALNADENGSIEDLKEIANLNLDADGNQDQGNNGAGEGDNGDDDGNDGGSDQGGQGDAGAQAAGEGAATETNNQGNDDDGDDGQQEFNHNYHVAPVENFDEQIKAIADEKIALRAQLTAGDIELDAYEDQKDQLIAKEQALREQNLKATIAQEQAQQNNQARWQWEQERFFGSKDNEIYQDKYLMVMLDAAIKDLANLPENASRNGAWFLQEADKIVRARTGNTKEQAQPNAGENQNNQAAANRKPDLNKIPKSLGNLPSADLNDTGSDEFSHLDRLEGMELEMALAKMPKDQQQRYLGAAA